MTRQVSLQASRAMLLSAQGMLHAPDHPAEKQDVLAAIRRMHVLQIDTIHVVARSPYFVLFSRIGAYDPHWLNELLAEGKLFEYWSHAACFLPIEDFPLYRPQMVSLRNGWFGADAWLNENQTLVQHVLERIRAEGGLRSADFEREERQAGGWWNWKEEKVALENLFLRGRLMIARREKFQRVYDLPERVLPGWDTEPMLDFAEVVRELTSRAVRALGVATTRWIPDYFRLPKRETYTALDELEQAGEVVKVELESQSDPAYVHQDDLERLTAAEAGELTPDYTSLLMPFDPLVWDRARAKALFDFDYTIECYTPAAKRVYGYFTLPILHKDRLVGRVDAKAHRKDGVFELKALHLEPQVKLTKKLAADVSKAIQRCADWHAAPRVVVRRTVPGEFAPMLPFEFTPLKEDND